jgi:cytochrome c oxidase subunit 2
MTLPRRLALALLPALACGGCQGWQNALDPKGPDSFEIARIFWLFVDVCAVVWVLVLLFLAVAIFRARPVRPDPLERDPAQERRMGIVVGVFVALTGFVLLGLTAISYAGQKRLFDRTSEQISIVLTGHQWWWEVQYEDQQPDKTFTTANEIHIPVGVPVRIKLESSDVIHSFWVPSLAGKQDLITGKQNIIQIQADRQGVYRAQCAEFCGFQHAHMAMLVVAETREEFDAWRNRQISAREPPTEDERKEGEQVFLNNACVMCHTVRGTSAASRVGPDLTHVAGRRTIAAGTLPVTRGTLAAWIVDPQRIKPGANMPLIKLEPDELNKLAAYLEGLK